MRKNSIVKIKTIFMIKSEKTLTEELSALAALIKIFDAFEEQRVCGKSKSLLPILKETAVRIMEDVRYRSSEYRSFFYGKDRYRTDEVFSRAFYNLLFDFCRELYMDMMESNVLLKKNILFSRVYTGLLFKFMNEAPAVYRPFVHVVFKLTLKRFELMNEDEKNLILKVLEYVGDTEKRQQLEDMK